MSVRTFALAAAVLSTSLTRSRAGTLEADDLAGPPLEVASGEPAVTVPALPTFQLPLGEPGVHAPFELRVHGRALLGSELQVEGYVTAAYDCVAALAALNPKASRAQIAASVDKTPSLCEPAKLYLGDTRTTPREASIWIVDVPRAPTRAERQHLSKAELAALPAVPRVAAGDHVTITGTWAAQSAHGEHDREGVLIYRSLAKTAPPAPMLAAFLPPVSAAVPDVAVVPRPPPRAAVDARARTTSMVQLAACNKAFAARQYDAAIAACQLATQAWSGNHLAWYTGASAHMARNEWPAAQAGTDEAVTRRPDQAMYQLYAGVARYEAEHARVRDPRADHADAASPAALQLDAARDALLRAAKLAPALWRAHFYLSRVYHDLDDAPREAAQLAQTIATHSSYRFGYLALVDLYLRWDYHDAAIAIAVLGAAHVAPAESPELWFAAGTAYEAKHADDAALDAYTKAIAGKPDDALAKFHRGQLYARKADVANARRDLEDVIASTDPRVAPAKPAAAQLLAQLARH